MFGKRNRHAASRAEDQVRLDAECDTVRSVLSRYPGRVELSFGAPTRCPRCGDYGLVVSVDRAARVSAHACVTCGTEWSITARALRAVRARPPALPAVEDLGGPSIRVLPPDPLSARPDPVRVAAPRPPAAPLRVLHVEDDPNDAAVVAELVRPSAAVIDLRTAADRSSGVAAAASMNPDLVLLDLGLPDSHGLQTIARWHFETGASSPVLVLSEHVEPAIMGRSRGLGVVDFLAKGELSGYLAAGDSGSQRFVDRLGEAAGDALAGA